MATCTVTVNQVQGSVAVTASYGGQHVLPVVLRVLHRGDRLQWRWRRWRWLRWRWLRWRWLRWHRWRWSGRRLPAPGRGLRAGLLLRFPVDVGQSDHEATGDHPTENGPRAVVSSPVQGWAIMMTTPTTSRTRTGPAALADGRGVARYTQSGPARVPRGAERAEGGLQPPLRRPQHPLAQQGDATKSARPPSTHPPEGVDVPAHGEQREPEDGMPVAVRPAQLIPGRK